MKPTVGVATPHELRLPGAARLAAGLAGGLLAIAATMTASAILVTALYLVAEPLQVEPALTFGMVLGTGGVAFGIFVGGAVARRISGTRRWRGSLGLACALGFLLICFLAPHWGWIVVPGRGWGLALWPRGPGPSWLDEEDFVRDYPGWVWLLAAAVGGALGWLGDTWALRRWLGLNRERR